MADNLEPRQIGIRKVFKVAKYNLAQKEHIKGKFIYILKCGIYHKIGFTDNFPKRLSSIKTANPYLVEKVFAERFKNAVPLETTLHGIFKKKRCRGEWFKLSKRDIDVIIETIKEFGNKDYGKGSQVKSKTRSIL